MRFFLFFCCLFVFVLVPLPAAEWEVVKYERNEYVTLRSFCKFYHLSYPEGSLERETITLKNSAIVLTISKGGRNCLINGIRHWSTFNIVEGDTDWLISKKDVTKFFDPILRPLGLPSAAETRGVVIDPGHGGEDRGAISRKGIREKDCTLDTGLRLERILKSKGISTIMTRRSDVFIELEERAEIAARYPDYIFVSIHFNDASGSARGIETYCFPPLGADSTEYEGRTFSRDKIKMFGNENDVLNIFLASAIHRQVTKLNPNDDEADRGVKRARFVVLKSNRLPAVLVEGGFLSNRQESARISSDEYRQSLAERIAAGIEFFFKRGESSPVTPKTPPVKKAEPKLVAPVIALPATNAPTIVRPSTNAIVLVPPVNSTNSTNTYKKIPSPKIINVPLTASTNRPPDVAKVGKPVTSSNLQTNLQTNIPSIPSTNSVAAPNGTTTNLIRRLETNGVISPLYSMTNAPAATNSLDQPIRLNSTPSVELNSEATIDRPQIETSEKIVSPEKNEKTEKTEKNEKRESAPKESFVPPVSPPPPSASSLQPRPEAQEEAVPAHEEPAVEIYMQDPPQPRIPKVDLRVIERVVEPSRSAPSTNAAPAEVKP